MSERGGPPPDWTGMQLDFSEFHPLDHTLWGCREMPGGRRVHLRYRWEFQWSYTVRRWTWCLVGRHDFVTWWRRVDGVVTEMPQRCSVCAKPK